MKREQAVTVAKLFLSGVAAVAVLAAYWLYLEYGTLGNDVPDDHITAALGAFLRAEPWAAVGIVVLVVGGLAFAIGLLTGHIGEAAKVDAQGAAAAPALGACGSSSSSRRMTARTRAAIAAVGTRCLTKQGIRAVAAHRAGPARVGRKSK